jgi:mersacidin/lichenicidin family type 2 lantibiotic
MSDAIRPTGKLSNEAMIRAWKDRSFAKSIDPTLAGELPDNPAGRALRAASSPRATGDAPDSYSTDCYSTSCYSTSCYSTSCYSTECYSTACYSTACYSTRCYSTFCNSSPCETLQCPSGPKKCP